MARPTTAPDFATAATYAAGPQAGSTNKVNPTLVRAQGWKPSDLVAAEHQNYLYNNNAAWINFEDLLGSIFGLGDDGALNLVAQPPLTLTADMHYTSIATDGASVLHTAGYRVFCSGTCSLAAGAVIDCNGATASNQTAGVGVNGSLFGGTTGGTGTNAAGANGQAVVDTWGGRGATGGAGGSGGGGLGGTGALPPATFSNFLDMPSLMSLYFVGQSSGTPAVRGLHGGSGGGAGGGAGGGVLGGGGGAGAGIVFLAAHAIVNGGSINAKGGHGGNGTGGAGSGGGGGGGGGVVVLVTRSLTGAGTTDVTGGTGGTGSLFAGGTGASGTTWIRTI